MKAFKLFLATLTLSLLFTTQVFAGEYPEYVYTDELQTVTLGSVTFTNVNYYEEGVSVDAAYNGIPIVSVYLNSAGYSVIFNEDNTSFQLGTGTNGLWNGQYVSMTNTFFLYGREHTFKLYSWDTSGVTVLNGDYVKAGSVIVHEDYETAYGYTTQRMTIEIDGVKTYYNLIQEQTRGFASGVTGPDSASLSEILGDTSGGVLGTTVADIIANSENGSTTTTPTPETTVSKAGTANITTSKVLVDGVEVAFEAYNINDNNYFKLRDIAYVLMGTDKQFQVEWSNEMNAINMLTGGTYTIVGGEMQTTTNQTADYTLYEGMMYQDGAWVQPTGYTINDNNFFKLRDVGILFDFDVSWDNDLGCILIETDKSYTED
ncbi:MAG: hypothetical protein R3Y09_04170 [Clostridia bacterium]